MAKIYCRLVKAGSWKLEDVPEIWRAEVERLLDEEGGDR